MEETQCGWQLWCQLIASLWSRTKRNVQPCVTCPFSLLSPYLPRPIEPMEYMGEEYFKSKNTVIKYERYLLKVCPLLVWSIWKQLLIVEMSSRFWWSLFYDGQSHMSFVFVFRHLQELGFCVHVKHPHKVSYLNGCETNHHTYTHLSHTHTQLIITYLQILGLEKNATLGQKAWWVP